MNNKKIIYIIVGLIAVLVIGFAVFSVTRTAGIEKQLMELELQEEALEMEYRAGKISFEEYSARKLELESKENNLELQEDVLEFDL